MCLSLALSDRTRRLVLITPDVDGQSAQARQVLMQCTSGWSADVGIVPDLTLAMLTDGCRLCAEYIDRRLVKEESAPACAKQDAAI